MPHIVVGAVTPGEGNVTVFGGVEDALSRVRFPAEDKPVHDGFTVAGR
ncbi:hypothetical protein [Actinophytocola oryzae]|uniref:Uncharacterized protein n=1 Tax=Actinophytocola oryzae TaxID=502181 RepID=A0A4R7UNF0_9PSEU|nr:hypothetical protein [Actinophytocola oryzae]TDV34511.1 hypothetical protein CLV71_1394 [Actinophytocola oryzae]